MPPERHDARDRDDFERLRPVDAEPAPSRAGRLARLSEQVEEGGVELRPRGVGETLDLGLDLVRSRFALCVGLGTLAWVPIRILGIFLRQEPVTGAASFDQIMEAMSGSFAVNLTYSVGTLLVAALTARIVADAIASRDTSAGRALRTAVVRLPGLIVIGILEYVAMVVGMLMCIAPGLALMWLLTPCAYIYVLEGVSVPTAVRRSFRISCGPFFSWTSFFAFWRWSGIMAVTAALLLPFSSLVGVAELPQLRDWAMSELALSASAWEVLSVVLGALFLGVATALQASILTVYYLDCRIRREGLDLETWLARLKPARATITSAGAGGAFGPLPQGGAV